MKTNLVKAVASLATATTLLFSTATCFAATANTVTTYGEDGVTVTSTIKDVVEGQMVTYLAGAGEGTIESKEDIVYITQWTSDGSDKVVSYNLKSVPAINTLAATVKYGSDVADTAAALNNDAYASVQIAGVTATFDADLVTLTVNDKVGSGDKVVAAWEIDSNYELDTVIVNGAAVEVAGNSVEVPYAAGGATIEVNVKAKEGTPTVATFDEVINYNVQVGEEVLPSFGAVGKLTGTADEYGIYVTDAEGVEFEFEGMKGYFPAAGADKADEGYYAVNIAGKDLSGSYIVKSYVKFGGNCYYGTVKTAVVQ
jgi:hypothetical protein